MIVAKLDWLLAGGGLAAAGGAVWLALAIRKRRPRDPEALERRRREHVNRVGRIVEGKILDVVLAAAPLLATSAAVNSAASLAAGSNAPARRRWVVYCYSISGVTYETAQDISGLAPGPAPAVGGLASVKYDPGDPSNSILAAEDWSGLS